MDQGHGEAQRRIRLAIVGCGQIGRLHAQRITADGRATIAALCDPTRESAARLQSECAADARLFTDISEMAAGCVLDAAVICTPTHRHFDQARQLRGLGIPVLCEKPLADSRERIVQLIDETNAGGSPLVVAYQRRCWAVYRTLRREVQSGRHGPVGSLTAHVSERWGQTIAGTWRDDPAFNPGGFIGDAGSHKIDMVFFVTGLAPREVFAHSDRRGSRVEVVTMLTARLENDVPLSMNFIGDSQHFREDFQVHCAEADLIYRDGTVSVARNNKIEPVTDLEPESNPNAAFLDVLTGKAANFAPPSVALPVWDFTQAALESARTGKVVGIGGQVPPSRATGSTD
jgi:predicted dehydrogenase